MSYRQPIITEAIRIYELRSIPIEFLSFAVEILSISSKLPNQLKEVKYAKMGIFSINEAAALIIEIRKGSELPNGICKSPACAKTCGV